VAFLSAHQPLWPLGLQANSASNSRISCSADYGPSGQSANEGRLPDGQKCSPEREEVGPALDCAPALTADRPA